MKRKLTRRQMRRATDLGKAMKRTVEAVDQLWCVAGCLDMGLAIGMLSRADHGGLWVLSPIGFAALCFTVAWRRRKRPSENLEQPPGMTLDGSLR